MNETQNRKFLLCYPMATPQKGFVQPEEFLSWAENDLKGNDRRSQGNALGNIKKAIHCRIDEIINFTHLVCARDWNWMKVQTEDKLKIMDKLGVPGQSLTKIITDHRNTYEHKYKLPGLTDVKAHLETARYWLKDSYEKRPFGRVGIFGLAVKSVNKHGDEVSEIVVSSGFTKVSYFWDHKRLFSVASNKNPKPKEEKLQEMSWKDILNLEKESLRGVDAKDVIVLPQANLTEIFKICCNKRIPRLMKPLFEVDLHIKI